MQQREGGFGLSTGVASLSTCATRAERNARASSCATTMTDRGLEFKSACRLARKKLGAPAAADEPRAGAPALHQSLAARQSSAIAAKLSEIDGRLANLRAAAERKHDGGANAFERAMAAVERDCAWADKGIAAILAAADGKRGQRRDHERVIAATLRSRLGDRLREVQACAAARQRALKEQQKRRNKFSHSGPAISTRVQLDTPLFATAYKPRARAAARGRAAARRAARAARRAPPGAFAPSSSFAPSGLRARRPGAAAGAAAETQSRLQLQQEQQRQQMMLEQASRRLDTAHNIEKEIGKLGEVFSRFSSLVAQQAEVVERLDDDVEGALGEVEMGHAELLKAQEVLRGNRALFLKVFAVLIALIVLFVLF
ncbi:hypothetical protein JL720_2119 [Aureococcus anophagefferens]|nr:hypothetical protein JL720_2119 [Aureococcus anophagefferens]